MGVIGEMRLTGACKKCEYYRDGSCAYEQMMNRRLPCEMGVRCDFLPRYGDGSHPRAWRPVKGVDYGELERLYSAGLMDGEIMKALGVKRHVVIAWRKMKGVECHTFTDKYADRLWTLYAAGESDFRMARLLGISDSAVRSWRHAHGLVPNFVGGKRETANSKING